MSISNRPLQPPTHSSNINLFILIIIIILDDSDHHTRSRGIARERERERHDLPVTQAKKYGYADDLAILLQKKSWEDIEGGLTADMTILSTYLENWRLKLSIAKTMSSVFHLHNKEANREINITVNGNRLQFQSAPTYLGVKLDRTLSFRQHLENLSAKTTARVALIRRLAGTTRGAATKTLKVSTLALVYSAAEYCAPVWCRSSHTKKLDTVLLPCERFLDVCGPLQSTTCPSSQALPLPLYDGRRRFWRCPARPRQMKTTSSTGCSKRGLHEPV